MVTTPSNNLTSKRKKGWLTCGGRRLHEGNGSLCVWIDSVCTISVAYANKRA
jgi:hypothetical protein